MGRVSASSWLQPFSKSGQGSILRRSQPLVQSVGLLVTHHATERACQTDEGIKLRRTRDQGIDEPLLRDIHPLRISTPICRRRSQPYRATRYLWSPQTDYPIRSAYPVLHLFDGSQRHGESLPLGQGVQVRRRHAPSGRTRSAMVLIAISRGLCAFSANDSCVLSASFVTGSRAVIVTHPCPPPSVR